MSEIYIRAQNLGLDLPVLTQSQRRSSTSLKVLLRAAVERPQRQVRTTLNDLSFALEPGDRLGIIGMNGAGKSTLLKVLVGAYLPTRGQLNISGSRQALLNLSLGFNQEATVTENVLLRGAAMGLTLSQASKAIDEVLDFAELDGKAGDRMGTLSSGQKMRLGFAIATAVQHDILVMDEWIGTGDAAFLEKAHVRLQAKVDNAKIVVIATHSASLLQRLCSKALLLKQGDCQFYGPPDQALEIYRKTRT